MRFGTRLLLPLLAVLTLLMALYGVWTVRQRGAAMIAEAHQETQAYATALGIALEYAFADRRLRDVEEIMARIADEPRIYGVLIYAEDARILSAAAPLRGSDSVPSGVVRRVIATGRPTMLDRFVRGEEVYSVLQPLRGPQGRSVGVLEVVQPLSFVHTEMTGMRRRLASVTLLLLAMVAVLVLGLVRRMVGRPLGHFVAAARALGRGELGFRVGGSPGGRELAELAQEFNRMAEQLETARDRATREAEEKLQLERRLRETEKLAAVGNLAASLAHEIAAPLNVVSGRAQMLRKQESTAAARDRNIAIINDQIGRITLIVRNLLDFARRREPRLKPIDVGPVLDTVIEFLQEEFERANLRLVREGLGSAWVQGDADLLQQVFSNILLNALQALQAKEEEGRITVCIRPRDAARNVVAIEVVDNGPGIPEDLLLQVFEPFVTTKRDRTGTGLGLAVARSIVEEHGGRLEAWNRSAATGSGAVFRLLLPAAPAPEV